MNLRVIKKDVNFLIDEFISDAFISMSFTDDMDKAEKIVALTNDALVLQEETLMKINHMPEEKKDRKAYYRNLTDELLGSLDVIYDKLSEIVSKKNN